MARILYTEGQSQIHDYAITLLMTLSYLFSSYLSVNKHSVVITPLIINLTDYMSI